MGCKDGCRRIQRTLLWGSLKDIVVVGVSTNIVTMRTSKGIIKVGRKHVAKSRMLTSLPICTWICEDGVRYLDFTKEELDILSRGYMELGLLVKTESSSSK